MQKIFRFFLSSNRKRRCLVAAVILWLLRLLRDVEVDEMERNSSLLDNFESVPEGYLRSKYNAIEEEYTSCEFTLGALDSAIEDIGFVY